MATIKSEYYRFNGIAWDVHYFKTTMDMVDGLTSALAGKANLSGANFTGQVRTPQLILDNPIQNFNPFSGYKIHDSIQTNMLAGKWKKLKVTWDGVENPNMARNITDQNYEQYSGDTPHGLDGDPDHVLDIDVVTNGLYGSSGITYAAGTLVFNFYYSPFPSAWSCRWRNSDGVWTTIALTKNGASQLVGTLPGNALYLTNIELTLSTGTGAPYVTSNIKWGLSEVEYYGNRMALNQGAHVSAVGGYMSGDLDVGGLLKANGQQVYHPGNKPSLVDLGALVESNNKLLFGSTTQYIRLAYASKSQAFIKHGAGVEYELYHTGNFNPSNYLPLTQPVGGSIINGAITFNDIVSFNQSIVLNTLYVDTITNDGGSLVFSALDSLNFNGAVLMNVSDPFNAGDAINKGYLDARITLPDSNTVKLQKNFVVLQSHSDVLTLGDESLPSLICGPSGQGAFEIYGGLSATLDIYSRGKKVATLGSVVQKTGSYTFALADADNFIYSNSSSALTFTIPTNASVSFPIGTEIHIYRFGSGELSIAPASGVSLSSDGGKRNVSAQHTAVTIKKILSDTWVLIGALKA